MHKHPLVDAASWFVSRSEPLSLFVSAFVGDSGDFKLSVSEVNISYLSPQVPFLCSPDRYGNVPS